jgi:hypothetical protein
MPTISDLLRDRSPLGRVLFVAFVLVAAAALTLGVLWFFGFPPFGPSVTDTFPPAALDDYLLPDTAAVVAIDLKELRDRGLLDTPLGKALHEALTAEDSGFPSALLGVDPARDLDMVRLVFAPRDAGRPLVLMRGRFDRTRFRTGPGQLEEVRQDGFRLYRHRDPGRDATLALAGDTLVLCLDRPRVVAALRHASGKVRTALKDGSLKTMLGQVDRRQPIWFAVDMVRLGKPTQVPREVEAQLRPILEAAEALWGVATWGKELRMEIVITTASDEKAVRLEKHLGDVKTIAEAALIFAVAPDTKAILGLFANGEVTRREAEVTLRSRVGL